MRNIHIALLSAMPSEIGKTLDYIENIKEYKFGDLTLGASCRTIGRGELDTPGKSEEIPHSDEECDWSYTESRCEHPEKCFYKLCVGDITFDQSCR